MREAARTWQETIIKHNLTQVALKYAFWARTATWCHVAESPDFFCPFCRRECRSWGGHITTECFISSVASFLGFIAVAEFSHAEGWSMDWVTIESVWFSKKGKAEHLSLVSESRLTDGGEVGHGEVLLSKSGLIRMHEKGPCNLALRANLATAFLGNRSMASPVPLPTPTLPVRKETPCLAQEDRDAMGIPHLRQSHGTRMCTEGSRV